MPPTTAMALAALSVALLLCAGGAWAAETDAALDEFGDGPAKVASEGPEASDDGASEEGEAGSSGAFQLLTMFGWIGAMAALWLGNLYMNQSNMLYHPNQPPGFKKPSDLPAAVCMNHPGQRTPPLAYEEVWVTASDGVRVHCWLVWAKEEEDRRSVPTLVFLHGNAGSELNPLG